MIWWASLVASGATPADALAQRAPGAEAELAYCARHACEPGGVARAAWLLALHRYLDEGHADPELTAAVRVLDADLFAGLPDVLQAAAGAPPAWAERTLEADETVHTLWLDGTPVRAQRIEPPPQRTSWASTAPSDDPRVRARVDRLNAARVASAGEQEAWLRKSIVSRPPVVQLEGLGGHAGLDELARAEEELAAGHLSSGVRRLRALITDGVADERVRDAAAIRLGRFEVGRANDDRAAQYYAQVVDGPYRTTAAAEAAIAAWLGGGGQDAQRTLRRLARRDPFAASALAVVEVEVEVEGGGG